MFYAKSEYVFHLAVHFANQSSIYHLETDLMVNGMGTLNVLEYCRLVEPEDIAVALANGGDCFCMIDADGQFSASQIKILVDYTLQSRSDMITDSGFLSEINHGCIPLHKRVFNSLVANEISLLITQKKSQMQNLDSDFSHLGLQNTLD